MKEVEKQKEEEQADIKIMAEKIERIEHHRRRKVKGATENNSERITDKALEILNEKLKLILGNNDLENCIRIGKTKNGNRTMLVGFTKENAKKWQFKTEEN